MSLFSVAIALHVVVAVLGIGVAGAIPITAHLLRGASDTGTTGDRLLGALLRSTQLSFAAMLVTGVLLDVSMDGAFHRTMWLRLCVPAFVVIGVAFGRARATLKKARASGKVEDLALLRIERWGLVMCAGIAVVTLLMQARPS